MPSDEAKAFELKVLAMTERLMEQCQRESADPAVAAAATLTASSIMHMMMDFSRDEILQVMTSTVDWALQSRALQQAEGLS